MKMCKFYEVSKVLDRRTDTDGQVQYVVRLAGYGKAYDSWVDEEVRVCQCCETNLKTFFLRHASILTINLSQHANA